MSPLAMTGIDTAFTICQWSGTPHPIEAVCAGATMNGEHLTPASSAIRAMVTPLRFL